MQHRQLGTDGPMVSAVGLGCNTFGVTVDAAGAREVVAAALAAGVTHFDTAQSYGGGQSEELLGAALGRRRDEAFVATKVARRPPGEPWRPGLLARRIAESAETSLRRLGTDHVDLYYEHYRDPDAPLEEALEALDGLVRQGKARFVGCSNIPPAELRRVRPVAEAAGLAVPCAVQLEWSLLARGNEDDAVPAARDAGIGIVPYFPLASGLLTGKYRAGAPFPPGSRLARLPRFAGVATPENLAAVERLAAFAAERGHQVAELAVAWLLAQPGVASVITGATSPAQVQVNARGAAWVLSAEDRDEAARLAQARPAAER